MYFAFYLIPCVDHAYEGEDSLEYFDDFVAYAVAGFGFVVDFTS